MRFRKLDLNLLVALDHLLHLRSVSAAAEQLNMTQPAMSNALSRLRIYFDDDLLVKVGRRFELTPRAEALRDPVRDVLTRVEWTIAAAPQFDPARSDRRFAILASDYTLATLAPAILAEAQEAASLVRLAFFSQSGSAERLLDRGDVDLVIIPSVFCAKRRPTEIVLEEEFAAIVWRHGRLAGKKLTRKAFEAAGHVVAQPQSEAPSLELMFLQEIGVARRVEVTSYSFLALPHLVVGGDRIATVHGRLARLAAATLPIEIQPLPFRLPKMRQAMQWHPSRAQDPGLIWLRELIRRAVRRAQA